MLRRAALLPAFAFGLAHGGAHAQVVPYEPEAGFFVPPVPVIASDAFTQCATDLPVGGVLADVVDLGCEVVDSTRLAASEAGRGGEREPATWMLMYRRGATIDYEEFVDTLPIDELVLLRERAAGLHEIVWHLPRIWTYEYLQQVESVARDGGVLVSYLVCLNGTGGCAQHFLFGTSEWAVVAEPYFEDLLALVPDGWSIHKGRLIDLTTLEGVQPISKPGDGNCCPSGSIRFRVALEGASLRLVGAEVSAGAPH